MRRPCVDKAGLFDETIFIPADWDFWLRLSECYKAGYLNEPLTEYRVVDGYTLRNLEQSEREEAAVISGAIHRNRVLYAGLAKRAISRVYLRSAINYLLMGNFAKAKDKFQFCIRKYLFNAPVAFFLYVCFLIDRKRLRLRLIRKVFSENIIDGRQKI
jgi:hypothetical protein